VANAQAKSLVKHHIVGDAASHAGPRSRSVRHPFLRLICTGASAVAQRSPAPTIGAFLGSTGER
jgi:hypothetical protein